MPHWLQDWIRKLKAGITASILQPLIARRIKFDFEDNQDVVGPAQTQDTACHTRKKFIRWLLRLKQYARKHGIPLSDICIVGGAVLEAVGIRESTDIDFVVSDRLREKYGDGGLHLLPDISIATRGYVRGIDGVHVTDEDLIFDGNQHFIFMGLKFANLENVLYRKKEGTQREKDIRDVELIEQFLATQKE